MSDVVPEAPTYKIEITLNENDISYTTGGLDVPNMCFWLDVVKQMVINRVLSSEHEIPLPVPSE